VPKTIKIDQCFAELLKNNTSMVILRHVYKTSNALDALNWTGLF